MVVSFVLLLLLGVGHLDLMLVVAALTLGDLFVFGRFCVAKVFWRFQRQVCCWPLMKNMHSPNFIFS